MVFEDNVETAWRLKWELTLESDSVELERGLVICILTSFPSDSGAGGYLKKLQ